MLSELFQKIFLYALDNQAKLAFIETKIDKSFNVKITKLIFY